MLTAHCCAGLVSLQSFNMHYVPVFYSGFGLVSLRTMLSFSGGKYSHMNLCSLWALAHGHRTDPEHMSPVAPLYWAELDWKRGCAASSGRGLAPPRRPLTPVWQSGSSHCSERDQETAIQIMAAAFLHTQNESRSLNVCGTGGAKHL